MVPAEQGLEPADPVLLQVIERLIQQLELAVGDACAQIGLHGAAGLLPGVHLRLEEADGAAAVLLGTVQRQIGLAQQRISRGAVDRGHDDADAGPDHDLGPVDRERCADRFGDPARDGAGVFRPLQPGHQDRELIRAQPRDRFRPMQARGEPRRHLPQDLVACRKSEGVVHRLEMVEVDEQRRERAAALQPGDRKVHRLPQHRPVRQPGQRVMARHMGDRLLRLHTIRHVLIGRNPTAVRHRLMHERDDPAVTDLQHHCAGLALGDLRHPALIQPVGLSLGECPSLGAEVDYRPERRADRRDRGPKLENLAKPAVD